jgi:hypothetical protein
MHEYTSMGAVILKWMSSKSRSTRKPPNLVDGLSVAENTSGFLHVFIKPWRFDAQRAVQENQLNRLQ